MEAPMGKPPAAGLRQIARICRSVEGIVRCQAFALLRLSVVRGIDMTDKKGSMQSYSLNEIACRLRFGKKRAYVRSGVTDYLMFCPAPSSKPTLIISVLYSKRVKLNGSLPRSNEWHNGDKKAQKPKMRAIMQLVVEVARSVMVILTSQVFQYLIECLFG